MEGASPDNSWQVIEQLSTTYNVLVAIRLMRNGRQARATLCGLEQAQARQIVVTMDDDLHASTRHERIANQTA